MNLRLAKKNDLPQLKKMYGEIINHMNKNNVQIWDEIYPCEFFQDDIKNENLYILTDEDEIAGAFVLCDSNDGGGYLL